MTIENNGTAEKQDDFSAAENAAKKNNTAVYTHTFRPALEWMGKKYETLEFDFGKLTGKDALAIEDELAAKGVNVFVPATSAKYLVAMASKASGLGADAFDAMPLRDFNRIRSRARNFLISSEL